MKNLKYIMILFLCVGMLSCEEELVTYDEEIDLEEIAENSLSSPFIKVLTSNISFVAGEESYGISFLAVAPPSADFVSVNVYKAFTDSRTAKTSEKVLLKNYPIEPVDFRDEVSDNITFAQLREGITIDGDPISENELDLGIGSSWTLSFEGVKADGSASFEESATIVVAVLSPFAGNYSVIESDYWRINVQSGLADWTGETRFIGSINDTVFAHERIWGPSAFTWTPAAGPELAIIWDPETNKLSVPAEFNGVPQNYFSGNYVITCEDDLAFFSNVPCDSRLEPSEDGKHKMYLTYGYFTASGDENEGEREFYEVLEKIVE